MIEAVVVNWNSGGDLEHAVTELLAQRLDGPLRLLVVDNGSTDGSLERARRAVPDLEVVQAGANLGYTGGNNLGFANLRMDDFVLVMNPDVRLPGADELSRLAAALNADPGLAAVAPLIVSDAGQVEYTDTVLNLTLALVGKAVKAERPSGVHPQEWLDGAMFLARAEAIQSVGGFDDRYFLFDDEVDLALRLREAGWRLGLVSEVCVRHARGSSFGLSRKGLYYFWRNLYLLCSLHAPGHFIWRAAWAARLLKNIVSPAHVQGRRAEPMLRGALDAVRGRYGPGPEDR